MFIPIHDANRLRNIELHYATLSLILINIAIFFLVPVGTPNVGNFMLIPSSLTGQGPAFGDVPEAVTLLTYSFLHYDFWHLAGNMIFLWVFGDNVEDAVGHVRFLLFYALCTIGGGLAHVLVAPGSPVPLIGASGAVAGIVAAYLMLHPKVRIWVLLFAKIPLRLSAMWVLGAWIAYQVAYALIEGDALVAWWTHVGGVVVGALLIVVLRRPGIALFDRDLDPAPSGAAPP